MFPKFIERIVVALYRSGSQTVCGGPLRSIAGAGGEHDALYLPILAERLASSK
jgi:hypothetical protein